MMYLKTGAKEGEAVLMMADWLLRHCSMEGGDDSIRQLDLGMPSIDVPYIA